MDDTLLISEDARHIAADFNHIKEMTGACDDMVINLLYQIMEVRKAVLSPIEKVLEWPRQN